MGEGDCAGEVTRGSGGLETASEPPAGPALGVPLAMAGEAPAPSEPNWMLLPEVGFPATGPPFGICPTVPLALMVTDGLRE